VARSSWAFVDELGTDAEGTAIVEAIVTMARSLGLGVVAEGVETVEQAARLRVLGCQFGQGYHFARPLPREELAAWLAGVGQPRAALDAVAD
jgi:EAL domain-containing protein (putative c-di-GMP-specific phosphodiesterase class I)